MAREKLKFHPYPRLNMDNDMYDKLLERFVSLNGVSRAFKKAGKNKRELFKVIHEGIWNFVLKNRSSFEAPINNYFNIEKRIGPTVLYRAFMPSSYQHREPEKLGFKIEVADLLCKYITGEIEMTFYKWTNSSSPNDLEKYLTEFYKDKKIKSIEVLYKNKEQKNKTEKKKKRKKVFNQINMNGENPQYIEEQVNNYFLKDKIKISSII